MQLRPKKINVLFVDGEISGRIKCTIDNRTIIAYKIPRDDLDKCRNRHELTNFTGVYFLFGYNENENKETIYVGQAGVRNASVTDKNKMLGILGRLIEHKNSVDADKEPEWNEAIVLITSGNTFGSTEISYLEHRFHNIAKEVDRYGVNNSNTPTKGNVTEEIECGLEDYIDDAVMIVGTLGHKVFVPTRSISTDPTSIGSLSIDAASTEKKVHMKGSGYEAYAIYTKEGITILKGSRISTSMAQSLAKSVRNYREDYKDKYDQETGEIKENIFFERLTPATSFVCGSNNYGYDAWIDEATNKTLRQLDKEKSENIVNDDAIIQSDDIDNYTSHNDVSSCEQTDVE